MHQEEGQMKRLAFLTWIAIIAALSGSATTAAVPPRPEQPHTDQFEVSGFGNLARLNPLDSKVKTTRTVNYRLVTSPGCLAGSIPTALQQVEQEAFGKLGQLR